MPVDLHYVYFELNGYRYGAWYRILSPQHLEVMAVGMLEVVRYAGSNPSEAVCAALQAFIERRAEAGLPVPGMPITEESTQDLPKAAERCQPSTALNS